MKKLAVRRLRRVLEFLQSRPLLFFDTFRGEDSLDIFLIFFLELVDPDAVQHASLLGVAFLQLHVICVWTVELLEHLGLRELRVTGL